MVVEKEANIFDQVVFKYPFIEPVKEKFSVVLILDNISEGVASKLLLNASATGHMIKLSFLNLSVF